MYYAVYSAIHVDMATKPSKIKYSRCTQRVGMKEMIGL